jgi:CTP:molybdopterin cytidylyltransferase MocA
MTPVTVLVLAPEIAPDAGPLERVLDAARTALAEHHRVGFAAAGDTTVIVRREPPDDTPFGARLRRLVEELAPDGLVVLGAGAIPLATPGDRRALVDAAGSSERQALANHRYSADAVAIARAREVLRDLPDLPSDNALPRWLAEEAGVAVRDLAARRRLAVDVDSPLDLLLLEGARGAPRLPLPADDAAMPVRHCLAALRRTAADPLAELLVAGRTSAADLRWLERHTRSRSRVLVEERGLRTASAAAALGRPNRRPPRSVLGKLLDRDGPVSLGRLVAGLADGALIDTRVLLAHRLGADERAWPSAEDRFASDLLLPDAIGDPWIRALTAAAAGSPVPILLGGHSLVGPGISLALGPRAGDASGGDPAQDRRP